MRMWVFLKKNLNTFFYFVKLSHQFPSINNPNKSKNINQNWFGSEDEPLQGFSWRSGSIRDTTGIVFWNDIFLHTDKKTGREKAICVIDTQGLFDNETSPLDNSRIFALGNLISSIQVVNLSGMIQEDNLQYLQFAAKLSEFVAADSENAEKIFQNLLFLVRDWVSELKHTNFIIGTRFFVKSSK